jgi:two-component system chemotaxis sensor kinase CheA
MRDREAAEKEHETQSVAIVDTNQRKRMLLFQHGETGRMAVDLALVARLEEFPRDAIEVAGEQEAVQYRGQIMPLVRVADALQSKRRMVSENGQEALQVVVYADKGRSVGLVVDRILDIVEESFVIQPQTGRRGVLGSAVLQKRVTDILDVPALVATALPSLASAGAQP